MITTKQHIYAVLAVLLLFFASSCSEDEPTVDPPGDELPDSVPSMTTVLIINEGNFQSSNGSISTFDVETETVNQSAFPAGTTVQNVRNTGDSIFYVVGNAPDRVEVLDGAFSSQSIISEGLDNPIDIAVVGDRAFVTNWGDIATAFGDNPDSYIAVIDLGQGEVVDSILLGRRPQDIILSEGQLFISHNSASVITTLNPSTLDTASISTPSGASEFVLDANDQLWVLCTGGSLFQLDPTSNTITQTLTGLTVDGSNEKMTIDLSTNTLYFIGGGNGMFTGLTNVFSVDASAQNPEAVSFATEGFAFYGIGVNAQTGNVYVGDSNGFQSTGTIIRYDPSGEVIDQFASGVGPNGFIFLD